jgi:hypothetical protein
MALPLASAGDRCAVFAALVASAEEKTHPISSTTMNDDRDFMGPPKQTVPRLLARKDVDPLIACDFIRRISVS